jgi:predicted metal-dependent enzyme (double-stranded beta helix superfamily)
MFDLDRFIAECRAAIAADPSFGAARDIVARAVADPAAIVARLGEPRRAGVEKLYHAPDLNILNFAWGPQMTLWPHNHLMRVVIGIYTGREDNIFWRRVPGAPDGRIEPAAVRCLGAGDAVVLEENVIHSVTNPLMRPTGAIHVYGGDFFGIKRSEWDPETLHERPFDLDGEMRWFEEMNALYATR